MAKQIKNQETEKLEKPVEVKKKDEIKPVDPAAYAKYTNLKFIQLSEAPLKDEQKKELAELEAELKKCSGAKSKLTVRAAIKNEQALMVAGVPVPKNIEKLVISENSTAYYFE